ncbi:MAG: glycosyltransferase family 9 protein [Candidatus Hydrogenedentes bacterium]|nr:glycosyltransferase family 9 protein [Candidatus Hydrogenedentota bacterium]
MSGKTLVIHTGGVGDFICALPALARLRANGPLEIAGIPERAALAVAAGIADAAHDLDRADFHTAFRMPSDRLRAFCAPFARAVVWMKDEDGALARGLRAAGIGEAQCFPGIPPAEWARHAAPWYADCLGVEIELPFQLEFPRAHCAPDVVLHPGSGDPKKNWPLDRFRALADRLGDAGLTYAWCLGPAEESLAPPPQPALQEMSLTALAGVLARARLFVGNDSGIGHLASVAGCPAVSIFGPTDPAVWRPIGPRTRVLQGTPWPEVEAVWAAARELLGIRA